MSFGFDFLKFKTGPKNLTILDFYNSGFNVFHTVSAKILCPSAVG